MSDFPSNPFSNPLWDEGNQPPSPHAQGWNHAQHAGYNETVPPENAQQLKSQVCWPEQYVDGQMAHGGSVELPVEPIQGTE